MAAMDIMALSEKRIKLKNLENQVASGELSLFDRCEVEQEILDIKAELGLFKANIQEGGECINCSG